jgi:DNA-binding response OmpR family regulator
MPEQKLLIADDDKDLPESLATRCRSLGLVVDTAHDAMTALSIIDQNPPDLVILDNNMPSGSGLSVCEMMSHHEALAFIPVIMLTGERDEWIIRRCHKMCAYYVPKVADAWQRYLQPLLTEL